MATNTLHIGTKIDLSAAHAEHGWGPGIVGTVTGYCNAVGEPVDNPTHVHVAYGHPNGPCMLSIADAEAHAVDYLAGLEIVTRDEFFEAIGHHGNNHPTPEREYDDWFCLRTRRLVGRSLPGYMRPGDPSVYALTPEFRASASARTKPIV